MKRNFFFLFLMVALDVLICLGVNANLLTSQKEHLSLEAKVEELNLANQKLELSVAKLSSISRISELAKSMTLDLNQNRVVFVSASQFAKR